MELTGLEASLLSIIGGIILLALGYWFGQRGKQTVAACAKCQESCQKDMAVTIEAIRAKQAELSLRQDKFDEDIGEKLDLVFQMLRSVITYLPIDADKREAILNSKAKGGK